MERGHLSPSQAVEQANVKRLYRYIQCHISCFGMYHDSDELRIKWDVYIAMMKDYVSRETRGEKGQT